MIRAIALRSSLQESSMALRAEHLRVLAANGAIRRLTLSETAEGKYQLLVHCADGNESLLLTSRGSPRQWTQLNTLADHIRSLRANALRVEITFHPWAVHGQRQRVMSRKAKETKATVD